MLTLLDLPSKVPVLWQPWLVAATWSAAYVEIIDLHGCGFFTNHNRCGSRTFLSSFSLAFGKPILASVVLQQSRLFSLIGAGIWMILAGVLLLHESQTPSLFFRDITNCELYKVWFFKLTPAVILFQFFVIVLSYFGERRARRIYQLKSQLQVQLKYELSSVFRSEHAPDRLVSRATQVAQALEKRASDLTKRFVGYSGYPSA